MSALRTNTTLILSAEISELIPYSQNHLRRLEAKGQFPKRIRIGENRVAWLKDEIDSWIEERINARAEDA
jgi:prophage regulatory protein